VQGTYSPCSDGRVVLSNEAWRTIVAWNNLKINDIVMFLFHKVGEHFTSTKAIHISVYVIWFWFSCNHIEFICNARDDQLCNSTLVTMYISGSK
jgi:hypothetical protein